MKTDFKLFLSALSLAAVCSCSQEPAVEPVPGNVRYSVSLNIKTGSETMSSRKSYWTELDTLVVFDRDNAGVKFFTGVDGNSATAIFETDDWTGKEPLYASVSETADAAFCNADGILSVGLASRQEASAPELCPSNASAYVGKVIADVDNSCIDEMKPVMGFIRIPFIKTDISSIVASAPGGEKLAGRVEVNYGKLTSGERDFWTAPEGASSVTLVPGTSAIAEDTGGCFKAGAWLLALLPQTYSRGISLSFTGDDGKILYSYTVGEEDGLTIGRNEVVTVDTPHADPLPETISISLDFYNESNINPFGFGALASADEDAVNGEDYDYAYNYIFRGQEQVENLTFTICKGKAANARYYYAAPGQMTYGPVGRKILMFIATNAWIKVPGIEGRYLQSVTLSHGNGAPKQMMVKDNPESKANLGYTSKAGSQIATKDHLNTQTISWYSNSAQRTEMGKPYYLYFNVGASLRVYHIKLVYTKELPIK